LATLSLKIKAVKRSNIIICYLKLMNKSENSLYLKNSLAVEYRSRVAARHDDALGTTSTSRVFIHASVAPRSLRLRAIIILLLGQARKIALPLHYCGQWHAMVGLLTYSVAPRLENSYGT